MSIERVKTDKGNLIVGMTLWIYTLNDRKMSNESDDYFLLYDLAEELDVICNTAGKTPLSVFFDTTDLEYNLSDEIDQNEVNEDLHIDPETGLAYGIDDMKWFDVTDGLASLSVLSTNEPSSTHRA